MADSEIIVYTRPGCPFCTALRAGLRRHGLDFQEINIWEDSDAAAVVRSIASGNETVPTVVIGEWSAVNPSANEVLAAAGEHAPGSVPVSKPGVVQATMNVLGIGN